MQIKYEKLEQVFDAALLYELTELVDGVKEHETLSFEQELSTVRGLVFSLQEVPEESVADFNVLYAQIQGYRSWISSVLIDIHREKSAWKEFKYRSSQLYRKGKNRLLTMRKDIQGLRNKEMQEAAVQEELSLIVDMQEVIKFRIECLEDVADTVYIKRDEITAANMDLSRQQRVIEILQGIGYPLTGHHKITMHQGSV